MWNVKHILHLINNTIIHNEKKYIYDFVVSIALILLVACGQNNKNTNKNSDKQVPLKVVTTFTILQDIMREIGGQRCWYS